MTEEEIKKKITNEMNEKINIIKKKYTDDCSSLLLDFIDNMENFNVAVNKYQQCNNIDQDIHTYNDLKIYFENQNLDFSKLKKKIDGNIWLSFLSSCNILYKSKTLFSSQNGMSLSNFYNFLFDFNKNNSNDVYLSSNYQIIDEQFFVKIHSESNYYYYKLQKQTTGNCGVHCVINSFLIANTIDNTDDKFIKLKNVDITYQKIINFYINCMYNYSYNIKININESKILSYGNYYLLYILKHIEYLKYYYDYDGQNDKILENTINNELQKFNEDNGGCSGPDIFITSVKLKNTKNNTQNIFDYFDYISASYVYYKDFVFTLYYENKYEYAIKNINYNNYTNYLYNSNEKIKYDPKYIFNEYNHNHYIDYNDYKNEIFCKGNLLKMKSMQDEIFFIKNFW